MVSAKSDEISFKMSFILMAFPVSGMSSMDALNTQDVALNFFTYRSETFSKRKFTSVSWGSIERKYGETLSSSYIYNNWYWLYNVLYVPLSRTLAALRNLIALLLALLDFRCSFMTFRILGCLLLISRCNLPIYLTDFRVDCCAFCNKFWRRSRLVEFIVI